MTKGLVEGPVQNSFVFVIDIVQSVTDMCTYMHIIIWKSREYNDVNLVIFFQFSHFWS